MSTGKTENLELNQWVLDDPYLMEEVNEDNRKIDAAIPRVKLFDITLTSQTANFDLDFSEIDSSQFLTLDFYISINTSTNSDLPVLRINSFTGDYDVWYGSGSTVNKMMYVESGHSVLDISDKHRIVWVPPRPGNQKGGSITYGGLGASRINSFNFFSRTGEICYPAGSKILVYGVKK